jgi:hypothetical protein
MEFCKKLSNYFSFDENQTNMLDSICEDISACISRVHGAYPSSHKKK